jgi:hypothetical protein
LVRSIGQAIATNALSIILVACRLSDVFIGTGHDAFAGVALHSSSSVLRLRTAGALSLLVSARQAGDRPEQKRVPRRTGRSKASLTDLLADQVEQLRAIEAEKRWYRRR